MYKANSATNFRNFLWAQLFVGARECVQRKRVKAGSCAARPAGPEPPRPAITLPRTAQASNWSVPSKAVAAIVRRCWSCDDSHTVGDYRCSMNLRGVILPIVSTRHL